jgi:hypothetical protein
LWVSCARLRIAKREWGGVENRISVFNFVSRIIVLQVRISAHITHKNKKIICAYIFRRREDPPETRQRKLWERRKFPRCAYGYKKVLNPLTSSQFTMQFRNIDRAYRFTRAHNRHPELSVMEVFTLYSVYYLSRSGHASLKKVTDMMSLNKRSCTNGTLTKLRDKGYIIKHKFGITPVYTLTPLGSYYLFSLENTLKSLRVDR